MADTVVSLGKKNEVKSADKKVEGFLMRHRVLFLSVLGVAALAVCAVIVVFAVGEHSKKKSLAAIDAAEYALTKALPDGYTALDVAERQETALAALGPYLSKRGVVGVRANMLYADIQFQKADYAAALTYYTEAARLSRKNYTAPLNWFNAGVCAEELGSTADAAVYYGNAVSYPGEFLLAAHALFSLGRVKETSGDYEGAKESYRKLVDGYQGDTWANLAQSRLIYFEGAGL